jgi:hypothetical protein
MHPVVKPREERRKRQRFPLHCQVQFERLGEVLYGSVMNMSSRGFLCVVGEPLAPGDQLHCTIDLL